MKTMIVAAALSVSSLAIAQSASQPAPAEQAMSQPAPSQPTASEPAATPRNAQPSGQTVDDPSQSTGPRGVTQQGTVPNGRATAPAGTNMGPTTDMSATQSGALTPSPAAGEYPPCSRTVTDACVQTYERGVRAPRARR